MFRPLVFATAALALLPINASAEESARPQSQTEGQPQAQSGQPPQRIRQITLTGTEKCPTAAADEIVVCNRLDANEQFRVPKELRAPLEVPAQNQSWVNRAATVDQVGRVAGGLPNTCSPVGTGGQTGCSIVAARNYAAEKRQAKREAAIAAPNTDPDDDGK
jgi:hypothetical protein